MPAEVEPPEHITITPSVLCVGTPVVLVTTLNGDGTTNIDVLGVGAGRSSWG